jgi:hypothetical protein
MNHQQLLAEIEPYKREDDSYNIRELEHGLGIEPSLDQTIDRFFGGDDHAESDPRVALAVAINVEIATAAEEAERSAAQAALTRARNSTGNQDDWRLLAKRGVAVAEYDDPESNAITGYHLRGDRDIDGNIYSDQADIEANPGRL